MPVLPVLHHLPKLAQTHVLWVSDTIQLSHPLSSPSPPAFSLSHHIIFPSTRVFSNESALCIRWSKYWSFSFNISPASEYSEFISFDLLAVQGTLKSISFCCKTTYNVNSCVFCSVTQWCPTLCDPMHCSPPGSSDHENSQARILEWVAISSSRGSF